MEIKQRIKEARIVNGLDQREAAKLLEVTQAFYSRVESGTYTIPPAIYPKIIERFKISYEYLFEGKPVNEVDKLVNSLLKFREKAKGPVKDEKAG